VVLSYNAWQSMFAADPEIIGKKILVHGYPLEVVGIAQHGFGGVHEIPQDFWAPLAMIAQLDPDRDVRLRVIGRLKHSLTVPQARAALATIGAHLTENSPNAEKAINANLRSRATAAPISPQAVLILAPIFAAFGLVLIIACANVANIMLARAMARQREIGIRLSLGAARARLIRQLLTESILLGIPAAFVGLAISQTAIEFGVRAMFATLPQEFVDYLRIVPLTPDIRVFLYMMATAIGAALMFGLVPAIQATRTSVIQAARGDFSNEYRPARLRNALVVAQIAACSTLLICSGVLLRSVNRIGKMDTGLRTRDVLEIELQEKYRQNVLSELAANPLVEAIGGTSYEPLDARFSGLRVSDAHSPQALASFYDYASPEFFTIFDIRVLSGRNFSGSEAKSGAPVALVSQTLARRLWPDSSAVGKSIVLDNKTRGTQKLKFQSAQVIGVVGDINTGLIDDDGERSCVYFPTTAADKGRALVLRVKGDPEIARRKLDESLSAAYRGAVDEIHKMQEFAAGRTYPLQAAYWVSATVGAVALLLTITGIYGVLSYLVSQRTREIGIRMAMGASVRDVMAQVLVQSVRLAVIGIAIAMGLAFALMRVFALQLFAMEASDSWGYLSAILLVSVACIASAIIPSRRAAQIDPNIALRYD